MSNLQTNDKASVVVLAYNNLVNATIPCIESLYDTTSQDTFDLILVDNGSIDGTFEYFTKINERYNNVTVVRNETNLGFSRGNNKGIISALDNDYIFIANNDVLFTTGWLGKLVKVLKSDDHIGIVGPVTNFCDKSTAQYVDIDGITTSNYESLSRDQLSTSLAEVDRLIFFCVGFKRTLVDDIGLLDERFSPCWFEDDDYCLRAKYFGYKLMVVGDCFIYHNHSLTTSNVIDGNEIFKRNKEYLSHKHENIMCRFADIFFSKNRNKNYKMKSLATLKIGKFVFNFHIDKR